MFDIEENPEVIEGFTKAINKALVYVAENDAETIAIYAAVAVAGILVAAAFVTVKAKKVNN